MCVCVSYLTYCTPSFDVQGLIFVVDSNDRERVGLAREELHKLLQQDELRDVAVLVLANKSDLPNAMSTDELAHQLGLVPALASSNALAQ